MGNKLTTFLLILSPLLLFGQKDEIRKDEKSLLLSIEVLKRIDKVVLFHLDKNLNGTTKSSDGIVLQTANGDWKTFKLFSDFEEFGRIKNIEKFNKTFCIFLEKATLIIHSDSSIKKLHYISPSITLNDNKLYILNFRNLKRNLPIRSITGEKVYNNHLIEYNLESKTSIKSPIKKFPGHIDYIKDIEFFNDKVWISTYSRNGEFTYNLLYNISKQGEIYPDTIGTRLFPWRVFKIKKYKDELLIISSDGLKKMNLENEVNTDLFSKDNWWGVDANFFNHFLIWSSYDHKAIYDYQARTTNCFETHIYNLDIDKIISLPKSDLCCNTIKIDDEYIYSFNYKKGVVEKRNIQYTEEVEQFKIKNKNGVEQSIQRQ